MRSDAGAPQRRLRQRRRDEEEVENVFQERRFRRRRADPPSDSDDDFHCPGAEPPAHRHVNFNAVDQSSDSDSESASIDSAVCVDSDFDASGDEEEGDNEHDGDVDPMYDQGAGGDKKMWNTPEGWHRFRRGLKRFGNEMADFGHVCSICGERRHKCVQVPSQTLLDWYIAYDYEGLRDELYPQFPAKQHEIDVGNMYIATFIVQQQLFWVCARCNTEGLARPEMEKTDEEMVELFPMKFSKKNTNISFRWNDVHDPLQGLSLVDESMISLISALVTIHRLDGTYK